MSVNERIHSDSLMIKTNHAASCDFRVGGSYNIISVDWGANASYIAANLLKILKLPIFPMTLKDENIIGVGGAVKPLDITTAPVKVGQFQAPRRFII